MRSKKPKNYKLVTAGACLVALGAAFETKAQQVSTNSIDGDKLQKLEQQNQLLQKRLDTLENIATKNGLLPAGGAANGDPPVAAATDFSISGFVTASYMHDTSEPQGSHIIPGYLWDRVNDNISINKIKLVFASPPAERSGDKFDIAYRASFIAGQDAPIVNSGSGTTGFDYLREAYVEMNIPIGTGLNFRAGELISLLNYESGDGGAANNNASQGFQWFYTGNGPAGAVQLAYEFTDWVGVKVRIQNGLYSGPVDNNSSKTLVAAIDFKPSKNIWVNLIGFGGREDTFAQSEVGFSVLGGWQVTPEFSLGTELDYFDFYNHQTGPVLVPPMGDSTVYSGGLWAAYDFTKQVGLALRTEFLSDDKGVDASGGALGLVNPVGTGQDITSVSLTLNYKPDKRIKIQPEIRFDHTSWSHGWDPTSAATFSKQNRFIMGASVSYLF